MAYILGIDGGIASTGYAGVEIDNNDKPHNILFCGAHIFEAAEHPKDGSSLATPRREKRGLRRVIHRRAQRKRQIRALLAKHDLKDIHSIDQSRQEGTTLSPWDLRKAALERKLEDGEFARIFSISPSAEDFSQIKKAEPKTMTMKEKK